MGAGATDVLADVMAAAEASNGGSEAVVSGGGDPGGGAGQSEAADVSGAGAVGAEGGSAEREAGSEDAAGDVAAAARARNPDGTFTKAPKAKPDPKAAAPKPAQAVAPKPAQAVAPKEPAAAAPATAPPVASSSAAKPPPNWKPAAQAHWSKLPPEVQAEAIRVDREVRQVMNDSAAARKFHTDYQQMANPYLPLLGPDPIKATQNVYQTLYALHTGAPQVKAKVMAHLIRNYGIPIDALDSELAGQGSAPGAPAAQQAPAMDPNQIAQAVRQQLRQEMSQETAKSEWQKFMSTNPEHLDQIGYDGKTVPGGIRDRMDKLLRAGLASNYQEAYDAACWQHPETRGYLRQAEQADAVKGQGPSTQQAIAAASSVKSEPTGAIAPKSDRSIFEEVRVQAAKLTGGRGR